MAGIKHVKVDHDESGMRFDRWFKAHYPYVAFGDLQKLLRSGQIRLDGKRVKSGDRVNLDQVIRIPPLDFLSNNKNTSQSLSKLCESTDKDELLNRMLLYEDREVYVFNKLAGLAVQGGSGISLHMDYLLEAWRNAKGEKPRLVHRLDRETSGIFVVARTRNAAQSFSEAFRNRNTEKTYWLLVKGVPKKYEGRISSWLIKKEGIGSDYVKVAMHGEKGAGHAVSYFKVIQTVAKKFCWLEMKPYTGRTHQLRVHALHIGHPIIGDTKYFINDPNWHLPENIPKQLHLHARYIDIPHPSGGRLQVTAPLPSHMVQTWNLLGFDYHENV
ncbi:Ribosomal large subunit pseudouridine synthase C [Liberibacter crescens BT-1]|uniref:Ribosomal large subunit pseudouridine synthase C n=1 Tax=Liberibacter crescens (strain BT-1) TaxID=1215343 RepID=L0EWD8_LIBCB|nr:RluA family pseudouridine synthase [Liberibacter crescens]AGA65160.1 Ribosomal large subunit pseudouridine synthase C [Liberibacter crescens BT-1]AMC13122.1 pseudouridine synthase [Liberibacter crescens]